MGKDMDLSKGDITSISAYLDRLGLTEAEKVSFISCSTVHAVAATR
jgi:hypothetical protein